MKENIKNEIREMFASFDKVDTSFEKEYIMVLFEYLIQVFNDDKEILYMYHEIEKKMNLSSYERIIYLLSRKENIVEYIAKNKDFIYENIIIPERFKKMSADCIFPLKEDNISYVLKNFFLSINEDLFLFYEKMNSEGRIIYGPSCETTFTTTTNSNTLVFIKELGDLIDMLVLVHEIAHAYYFYLNNIKLSDRDSIEIELKDEIPAKIMEVKFIEFLRSHSLYEQSALLGNIFDYVYFEYSKKKYDFEGLKYIIASDIAITMGSDVEVNEFFKHIYKTSVRKLILENSEKKGKSYKKRFE